MKSFEDLAVILKRQNFGEASSIITVFTKNHGKLKILAKGSRKIKSKFMGHIEPFSLVKISIVSGRSFEILTSIEIKKSHHNLKGSLKHLPQLSYISEITECITCENLSNSALFCLITKTLSSSLWKDNPDTIVLFFLVNALKILGFSPHFDFCLKCKSKDLRKSYFSYYWGGILCEQCKDYHSHQMINQNTIRILRILELPQSSYNNIDDIGKKFSEIDNDLRKEAFGIMSRFLIYINEKKPNSLKFIESSLCKK